MNAIEIESVQAQAIQKSMQPNLHVEFVYFSAFFLTHIRLIIVFNIVFYRSTCIYLYWFFIKHMY